MAHPLDGARLKVVRAQEHLDALKAEIGRYLDSNPYEMVVEKRPNGWTTFPRIKTEPPLRLSTMIGDCLGNLRSALDHTMWQLAKRFVGRPLVIGKDKPYFPIFRDSKAFAGNSNSLAKYNITAAALDEIESVQPYHTGYEPLWPLHDLVNEDKHRLLLLTIGHIASVDTVKLTTALGVVEEIGGDGLIGLSGPAEVVARSADVEVESQATIFVTFQDLTMPREPVDRMLEQMVKCVADIIPRFDGLV